MCVKNTGHIVVGKCKWTLTVIRSPTSQPSSASETDQTARGSRVNAALCFLASRAIRCIRFYYVDSIIEVIFWRRTDMYMCVCVCISFRYIYRSFYFIVLKKWIFFSFYYVNITRKRNSERLFPPRKSRLHAEENIILLDIPGSNWLSTHKFQLILRSWNTRRDWKFILFHIFYHLLKLNRMCIRDSSNHAKLKVAFDLRSHSLDLFTIKVAVTDTKIESRYSSNSTPSNDF